MKQISYFYWKLFLDYLKHYTIFYTFQVYSKSTHYPELDFFFETYNVYLNFSEIAKSMSDFYSEYIKNLENLSCDGELVESEE